MNVEKTIARAIQRADSSYFFEDYSKQALAVLRALEAEGYRILPAEPPADICRKVADSMATGKMKPEEHIRDVYQKLMRLMGA